ncbi:MAG TPA: cyclase family protein [Chthoniobacterales bacterium]
MKFLDITRPLTGDLAPWPGDVKFTYSLVARLAEGASVNLGGITTSLHSGTHADAFYHFEEDGLTIDRFEPERYLGRTTVVDLSGRSNSLGEITIAELGSAATTPRLLLKTGGWPDSTVFPEAIPVLAPGVPEWLQRQGVRLLGCDLPSVDLLDSRDLPNHHALAAADVAILEGLDLSAVGAGVYSLSALPLKIAGGDGAPVRAVLWRDE